MKTWGSFELVGDSKNYDNYETGNPVSLQGLSADIGELPTDVAAGSGALCLDTGDFYKFHAISGIWYKL